VRHFREYMRLMQRDEPERFEEYITPLRGANLACWCPLDQPCHAEVLLEIANRDEVRTSFDAESPHRGSSNKSAGT